ncbi:hypothetical protein ACFQY4_10980 [Catellatospora bangladeshensis]|uniref:hypothetical protein n=1 Tax=Catellatospora bangladeshensis TaxID=310355 RepID=UPI00360AD4AE
MRRTVRRGLLLLTTATVLILGWPGPGAQAAAYLSHRSAVDVFRDAGISIWSSGNCSNRNKPSCTSFERIRRSTVDGILTLRKASKCDLRITGGTETGHGSGTYTHWNGWKIDISKYTCIGKYIKRYFKYVGYIRGWGYQYKAPSGNIYTDEGNHWDILYYSCGGCSSGDDDDNDLAPSPSAKPSAAPKPSASPTPSASPSSSPSQSASPSTSPPVAAAPVAPVASTVPSASPGSLPSAGPSASASEAARQPHRPVRPHRRRSPTWQVPHRWQALRRRSRPRVSRGRQARRLRGRRDRRARRRAPRRRPHHRRTLGWSRRRRCRRRPYTSPCRRRRNSCGPSTRPPRHHPRPWTPPRSTPRWADRDALSGKLHATEPPELQFPRKCKRVNP